MRKASRVDTFALWLGRAILGVVAVALIVQIVLRLTKKFVHFPAPPFVAVLLDSRFRKAIQPPDILMDRADVRPGMTVLELGSGPGTFTVEASRRVLPDGKVIAVDIEPRMIDRLQRKTALVGADNIAARLADAYHLPAPDHSVDLAFMVTVLAEIPDRARALGELRRILKPGGRLSISEFVIDPDFPRRRTVIGWCRNAGFQFERGYGGLFEYTLNFRNP